jgi:hypothetical protein
MCPYLVHQLSGFSTAGSKFLWIMCRAHMVSTRDNGFYTGSGLRGVIPYVQCRVAKKFWINYQHWHDPVRLFLTQPWKKIVRYQDDRPYGVCKTLHAKGIEPIRSKTQPNITTSFFWKLFKLWIHMLPCLWVSRVTHFPIIHQFFHVPLHILWHLLWHIHFCSRGIRGM